MNHYDLLYDGPRLQWPGHGIFRATSGVPGHQWSSLQCDADGGPIPEGSYALRLHLDETRPEPSADCALHPSWGVQAVPSGEAAGHCAPTWALWGHNRVRLVRTDPLPPACRVLRLPRFRGHLVYAASASSRKSASASFGVL